MQLDRSVIIEPFGKVEVHDHPEGIRVIARIRMKPQVENAQTGLAIDGSNSMTEHYGAHLPPLFRKSEHNVMQVVASSMAAMLADFDSDGNTSVIYWACGVGGAAIEVVGDMNSAQSASFAFTGPKKFGTGTRLAPAVRYFADKFPNAPWGIFVIVTDGRLDDLEDVKLLSLEIGQQMAAGTRGFTKFVLIGLGSQVDADQMGELDDMDYGGLKTPSGEQVDIWDARNAAEMDTLDSVFDECVGENSIIAPSATIVDSTGKLVKPQRRASYTDGLPALIEFICSRGSTAFTLSIPGLASYTQPLIQPCH
jgi:hypothetical protein